MPDIDKKEAPKKMDVPPHLHKRLKVLAAENGMSVKDYVAMILEKSLNEK